MLRNTGRLLRIYLSSTHYRLLSRGITSVTAKSAFLTKSTEKDPYQYQVGFGNRFASEAVPGTLPPDQNQPQKCKYDLYTEVITGTSFVTPRHQNQNAFLYRIRPSVAHLGFTPLPDTPDLESSFLPLNPRVHVSPTQLTWRPFSLPEKGSKVDFLSGLKTLAGSGDSALNEGQAIHIYTANTSMNKQAIVNADGDMLFVPQFGRLDIQTEFGHMMIRPGEICVIQRGIRFKVQLPDGDSRGFVQEIYGSHFELPELGPIGSAGLANPRDFEVPVASFDLDHSPWEIVYKLGGKLFTCKQNHTPFDVVAFHGNYVPYKYALEKFISIGSLSKDHIDPSINCVLTAKSKIAGTSLTDFLIFRARWDVATDTYRPAYYHRNAASEFLGMIEGHYGGRGDDFAAGAASYQCGHIPHGGAYEEFKAGSEMNLRPMYILEGTTIFMMESSHMLTVTDYAMNRTGKLDVHDPNIWDKLEAQFLRHIDSIDKALKDNKLPGLKN